MCRIRGCLGEQQVQQQALGTHLGVWGSRTQLCSLEGLKKLSRAHDPEQLEERRPRERRKGLNGPRSHGKEQGSDSKTYKPKEGSRLRS